MCLTAEPRTPPVRRVELGRVRMPEDRRYGDEYLEASKRLHEPGFRHYEVSSFARPGRVSRHNWHYRDGSEYLGLGPSTRSYLDGERTWNVYRWDRYRKAARAGKELRAGRERADAAGSRLPPTPEGRPRLDALASELAGLSRDEIRDTEMHGKAV
ncbi:MAG: hypothetical protein ACODAA_10015 [Gemmatimonadota bacterium]